MIPSNGRSALDLRIAKNYRTMSRWAADVIESELRSQPDLLLCASAGATPTGAYADLAARCVENRALAGSQWSD